MTDDALIQGAYESLCKRHGEIVAAVFQRAVEQHIPVEEAWTEGERDDLDAIRVLLDGLEAEALASGGAP